MTCFSAFVCGAVLLCFITGASADAMGLGYGSLFMQHDVKDKPNVPEQLELNPVKQVFNAAIEVGREILKGMERVVLDYDYKLTESDMDQLHECYYFKHFRNWHGMLSNSTELTKQEAFCKRLIDFKPTFAEATAYGVAHRFEAMSKAFKSFSLTKPFYPTMHELQEMEECFFAQSHEKKMHTSQLLPSETFCHRLHTDILKDRSG